MVRDKIKKILQETFPEQVLKGYPDLLDAAGERIFNEVVDPGIRDGIAETVIKIMSEKNLIAAADVQEYVKLILDEAYDKAKR